MAMADTFMLIRNADGDPLFMELSAGILYWLLPDEIPFTSIIYLTHITEDSKLYYENLITNESQWEINEINMSEEAKIVLSTVQQMSRGEVEEILGALFDIDKIDELIATIDNYFLEIQDKTVTGRRCSSVLMPIDPPVEDAIKNKNKLNSTSISYMEQIFNKSSEPVFEDPEEPVFEDPEEPVFEEIIINALNIKESIKANGKFRNSIRPMSRKPESLSAIVNIPVSKPSFDPHPNRPEPTAISENLSDRPLPPAKTISNPPSRRPSSIQEIPVVSDNQSPTSVPPLPSSQRPSLVISEPPKNTPEPPVVSTNLSNRSLPPTPGPPLPSSQRPSLVIPEPPKNTPEPPVVSTNLSNRSLPPTSGPPVIVSDPPSRRPSLIISEPPINRPEPPSSKAPAMEPTELAEDTKKVASNQNTRKSIFDLNKTFKTGYLNKLAKKSGINWKARYFVLGLYNISYFESEKTNEKLKGEVTITPESTVYSDKHDPKRGYLFKLTNQWETLVLAAASEIDRNEWLKEINVVIKNSKNYLMCYCALLQPSTSYIPQKRYFVLANGILTFHSSSQTTSKIEGKIILSDKTIIDKMDDFNQLITLSDSNSFLNRISFQFKQVDPVFRTNPTELYHQWKKELQRLVNPSSSSITNTRKSIRFSQSSMIVSDNLIDDNLTKPMNALQVNAIRRTSMKRNSITNTNTPSIPPQVPPRPSLSASAVVAGYSEEQLSHIHSSTITTNSTAASVVDEKMISLKTNILPSETLNIDAPIRSGKLIKLSRKTGLKWSARKFVLKPFQMTYYDNEVENGIIKGEIQITSQSSVVTEFKSDNKLGYLFKFTNQFESITLSASSETERDGWVKDISTAIKYASNCLFNYMILKRPLFKNHSDKYFLIFGFDTISIHQSEKQTSDLKGVFQFSNETFIEELDDYNKTITLNDSKSNISSLSFSCTYVEPKSKYNAAQLYSIWKSAISRLVEVKDNNEIHDKYNSKSIRRNSRKSVSLETTTNTNSSNIIHSTDKTPWCNSTNLTSAMKMNALETNALRRASLKRNSITIVEEEFDESLVSRPSFLALPPAPPPPSQNKHVITTSNHVNNNNMNQQHEEDNIDNDVEEEHVDEIDHHHQFQPRKSDVSNIVFTIDTCYVDQSKSNHMLKGEQNTASRAALKMQLSKLKEMKQQQTLSGNNFKPPPPTSPPNNITSPNHKIDVNPLLKNFQSPKNPLARSKH